MSPPGNGARAPRQKPDATITNGSDSTARTDNGHTTRDRLHWPAIIDRAAQIVGSYDTGVTLRQLHYRLVSAQLIPNTEAAYKRLSSLTAEAGRSGLFPDLIDRGRTIHRYQHFDDPAHALAALQSWYRLDRTIGQDVSLYIGVEKAGLVVQLQSWFSALGIPVLALGGYSSQSYVDNIVRDVEERDRPAVLVYGGDFDPSGEDIDRDLTERTDCWSAVVRVALTVAQVLEYQLPINPGKVTDSRAAGFIDRHGSLMQVEIDALPPETLRQLYADAIAEYWDTSAYEAVLAQERRGQDRLAEVATMAGDL